MEVLIGNLIELARFVREEEDQWTTVQHHRAGKNRSYASVAKTRANLSGANRIPIGSKTFPQHKVNQHPQSHRSLIFDRITWPRNSHSH
jgi:hypothetical protein